MNPLSVKWTAIVLTFTDSDSEETIRKEVDIRQKKGLIDASTVIITVQDPQAHVGSGGATLNALLVLAEHLSAHQGYTVVNPEVLENVVIAIFHMGRDFPFDGCYQAFSTLPASVKVSHSRAEHCLTNFDCLLYTLSNKIADLKRPGVWVCSTDMFLTVFTDIKEKLIFSCDDEEIQVCAISVPGSIEYAKQHGVYKIDSEGYLADIVYQGSEEEIELCKLPDGRVPMVCGLVFLSPSVVERLLKFHTYSQLYSCTYIGVDSGVKPIELSIFFDFLLTMGRNVTEQSFGLRNYHRASVPSDNNILQARKILWNELNDISVRVRVITDGQFDYLTKSPSNYHNLMLNNPKKLVNKEMCRWCHITHSYIEDAQNVPMDSIVINSIIGKDVKIGSKSVVTNCDLSVYEVSIGDQCVISGIQSHVLKGQCSLNLPNSTLLQSHFVSLPIFSGGIGQITTVLGLLDCFEATVEQGTFLNSPWSVFFTQTGIQPADLWNPEMPPSKKKLSNARLFPISHINSNIDLDDVLWLLNTKESDKNTTFLQRWRSSWRLSFQDIWSCRKMQTHLNYCRTLGFLVTKKLMRKTMFECNDTGLLRLYKTTCLQGFQSDLLQELDKIGCECRSPGIAARTLANIAEVLACMANNEGGLRSGPAANVRWLNAYQVLESGDIAGGVKAMAQERQYWLKQPTHLVRAARHYEGAAQILVRQATASARQFINTARCEISFPRGKWLQVNCCGRIDIAGGWSDTPPISYEHGGAVINAAITIDGKRPIGAKIRRISQPEICLVLGTGDDLPQTRLKLTKLSDFSDYCQPHAPGSLLKAAFLCTETIEYPSETSLEEQLISRYDGGFELHSWSNLPHGSGLGTSSILAGAVMKVIWTATDYTFDKATLVHGVLHLEQMLTTGGGWQDQVGGLYGGIKVGHSEAKLPLSVDVTYPNISSTMIKSFSDRLILVYTGKTRLAKNLLQDVIRNWYSRNPDIVNTVDQLVETAWTCAKAFEEEDLQKVGECINTYWNLKKCMASGAEPAAVRDMMHLLRPYTHGMSLAGAGGGGFLYVLTKEPHSAENIRKVLSQLPSTEHIVVHESTICNDAFTVEYLDE